MKKLLAVLVAAAFVSGSLFAEEAEKSCKDEKKAEEYNKYAKNYENDAEGAEKEGKTELAAALKKCAEAKKKMAEAYSTGNKELLEEANKGTTLAKGLEANKEYQEASKEKDALKGTKKTGEKKKKKKAKSGKKKSTPPAN